MVVTDKVMFVFKFANKISLGKAKYLFFIF